MKGRPGRWELLHLSAGHGDPVPADGHSVREVARQMRQVQQSLKDVKHQLAHAHAAKVWEGDAANSSAEHAQVVVQQLVQSTTKFAIAATALEQYAPELESARATTQTALLLAEDAERRRIANSRSLIRGGSLTASPELMEAEQRRIARLNRARADLRSAQAKAHAGEESFHQSARRCADSIDPAQVSPALLAMFGGLASSAATQLGVGALADVARGAPKDTSYLFKPRHSNGRWVSMSQFNAQGVWSRAWATVAGKNYVQRGPTALGSAIGKAGNWLTRAGGVLSVAGSAWNQWESDAHKGFDATERGVRSAVAGVLVGGTSFATGMAAGAVVGSFIPVPVLGTVVGAVVGGAVGWATSEVVGPAVSNFLDSDAGRAMTDSVGKAIDSGAKAVGDFAGSVGKGVGKLKFW